MSCPCCGALTVVDFSKTVRGKYSATYVTCTFCGTLHVVEPHWLDEAYGDPSADDKLDGGAAWRNATGARFIQTIQPVLPDGPWVDFGSGQGLLAQELSKSGLAIKNYDPRRGVTELPPKECALIACFEVLEHQTQPVEFMRVVGGLLNDEGVIVLSTWLRNPGVHGEEWGYLAVESGQHVLFPSRAGFKILCQQVGLRWWSTASSQEHPSFQVHVLSKRGSQPIEVPGFSVMSAEE